MLDDPLREQLTAWVHPVASWPVPDIRVLRRRARQRGIRRAVTAAAIAVVLAVAAVGVTAGLAGTGRSEGGRPVSPPAPRLVSPPSWPKAPGTWYPGAWRASGPLPAADASPAVAPYIVLLPPGRGTAEVRNMFTGTTIATITPPRGQFFSGVAAAGDDRTFVLQAEVGGQTPNSPMPFNPPTAAFDELRLKADGEVEYLSVLGAVPAGTALSGFAISQDASMLAYFTGAGFETVSLSTGTGKHWLPVDHGVVAPLSLSWAGDRTVAFEWGAGNNPHPPGIGLRVLNVAAPGNLLQASRLVVSYGRYCGAGPAGCQDGQLITPDGSRVLVTRTVGPNEHYTDSVLEYSVRTGRQLAQVIPTVRTPYAGPPCVPLWTNPSGKQVISFCGGQGERYDHGRLSRVTLHPPMYGLNFGAAFAW
ncbi:MAG TPA: hypothetical protein VGF32_03785 [Streptosporangiaceae bacterium]